MADELVTYRHGEIPDGMATMTMLARERRRPAPGQQPVGFYKISRGEVPLYAVADSVTLPAMTDKQHARWTADRTCARCGEVRPEPVPLADDGRRVDMECQRIERTAAARVTWLKLRMEAVAWAKAFLDKPDGTILVGGLFTRSSMDASPVELYAVRLKPMWPLVDVLAWPSPYRNITWAGTCWPRHPRHVRDRDGRRLAPGGGTVDCDEIVPHLYPLIGRTLVYLTLGGSGHPIDYLISNSQRWNTYEQSLFAGPALSPDRSGDNDFAVRWRDWLCEPQDIRWPWQGREGLVRQPVEAASAFDGVMQVRAGLLRMSTDDHPDGPALCPVLPATGLEPCGEPVGLSGTCALHESGIAPNSGGES